MMKPAGRKTVRFPSKVDHHLPKGHKNWWEVDLSAKNGKKRDRRDAKIESNSKISTIYEI